jgi:CMP-N-acetylneuraminic acid synthetase
VNTLAIIPARKGSHRLPDKNVKKFTERNGMPLNLVDLAIEFAMTRIPCSKVLLTTNYELSEFRTAWDFHHRKAPNKLMFVSRLPALCTPEATMAEVVEDALTVYKYQEGRYPDAFLLLQPTSPVRDHTAVLQALNLFEFNAVKALCSVNPNYKPDGNFYLLETETFLREKTFFPEGLYPIVQDWKRSVDIDTEQDFRMAQHIYENER